MTETAAGSGNPTDPSGFLTSPPSTMVKIINTARADMNGTVGIVLSYDTNRGRYNVSVLPGQTSALSSAGNAAAARAAGSGGGGGQPPVLSLKPENLIKASAIDRAKAHALVAADRIKRIAADPQVREQMRRAYSSVQSRLPRGVKPEHAGMALFVLWWVSVWYIGFSKTVMITSLSGLILSVCLQDFMAGCDARTVARNFPRRWREAIVQSTGFARITERQALAAFVVMMVLGAKIVVTPAPVRSPKTMAAATAATGNGAVVLEETPSPGQRPRGLDSINVEELYKMGFNDAREGKDYGASLPDLKEVTITSGHRALSNVEGVSSEYDPREWDLNPPPKPQQKSKFGFGTVMAAMTLFRFGKEIAINPDGQFDQQMAMANLNMMPKWKIGLVAFCLYQVVNAIF